MLDTGSVEVHKVGIESATFRLVVQHRNQLLHCVSHARRGVELPEANAGHECVCTCQWQVHTLLNSRLTYDSFYLFLLYELKRLFRTFTFTHKLLTKPLKDKYGICRSIPWQNVIAVWSFSFQISQPFLFKTCFNVIIPSKPRYDKWYVLFRNNTHIVVWICVSKFITNASLITSFTTYQTNVVVGRVKKKFLIWTFLSLMPPHTWFVQKVSGLTTVHEVDKAYCVLTPIVFNIFPLRSYTLRWTFLPLLETFCELLFRDV